jgi:hypothetical protein
MKQLYLKNLNIKVKEDDDPGDLIISPLTIQSGARVNEVSVSGWESTLSIYISTSQYSDGTDKYPIYIGDVSTSISSIKINYNNIIASSKSQYFNPTYLYYIVLSYAIQSSSFPIYFYSLPNLIFTNSPINNDTHLDTISLNGFTKSTNVYLSRSNNNFSGGDTTSILIGSYDINSGSTFTISYDDIINITQSFDGRYTKYYIVTDAWEQVSLYSFYFSKTLLVTATTTYIYGTLTLSNLLYDGSNINIYFTTIKDSYQGQDTSTNFYVGSFQVTTSTLNIPYDTVSSNQWFNPLTKYYIYTTGHQYTENSYYFNSTVPTLTITSPIDNNTVYNSISVSGVKLDSTPKNITVYLSTTQSIDQGFIVKTISTNGTFTITGSDVINANATFNSNQTYFVISVGDYTQVTSSAIYFKFTIDNLNITSPIDNNTVYDTINISGVNSIVSNITIYLSTTQSIAQGYNIKTILPSETFTITGSDVLLNNPTFNSNLTYYIISVGDYTQVTSSAIYFKFTTYDLTITSPIVDNTVYDTINISKVNSTISMGIYLSTTQSISQGFLVKTISASETFTITGNDVVLVKPTFNSNLTYYVISNGNYTQVTSSAIYFKFTIDNLTITSPIDNNTIYDTISVSGVNSIVSNITIYLSTSQSIDDGFIIKNIPPSETFTITGNDVITANATFNSNQTYFVISVGDYTQVTSIAIYFKFTIPDLNINSQIVDNTVYNTLIISGVKLTSTNMDIYLSTSQSIDDGFIIKNIPQTVIFTVTTNDVLLVNPLFDFNSNQTYFVISVGNYIQSTSLDIKFKITPLTITYPSNITTNDTIVSSLTIDGCLLDQTTPDGTSYNDMYLSITPIRNDESSTAINIGYTLVEEVIIPYKTVSYYSEVSSSDQSYYIVLANGQCTPYSVKFQIQPLTISSPQGTEANSIVISLTIDGCLLDQTNPTGTSYNDMYLSVTNFPSKYYIPIPITYTTTSSFTVSSDMVYSLTGFSYDQSYYIVTISNYQTTPYPIKFKRFLTITDPQGTSTNSYVDSLTVSGCLLESESTNAIYLSTTNDSGPAIFVKNTTDDEVIITYGSIYTLEGFDSSNSYYIVVGNYIRTTLWPIKFQPPLVITFPINTTNGQYVNTITLTGFALNQTQPNGTKYNDMFLSITNYYDTNNVPIFIQPTLTTGYTINYADVSSLIGFSSTTDYYIVTPNNQTTSVSVQFKKPLD